MSDDYTHFGYRKVKRDEKASRVADVFRSVADNYDIMNDLMSLGSHRILKDIAVEVSRVRPGHRVLDLAGGTGDIAARLAPKVAPDGEIVLSDINDTMLTQGRDQMLDRGFSDIKYVLSDAETLGFANETFDIVTMGFGLRNVTNKKVALKEILRVLKSGGRLVVLEFSTPDNDFIASAYKQYRRLWPHMGKFLANDAESYQYLDESIDMHPSAGALLSTIRDTGFDQARVRPLLGGIVAIHSGIRPYTERSTASPG